MHKARLQKNLHSLGKLTKKGTDKYVRTLPKRIFTIFPTAEYPPHLYLQGKYENKKSHYTNQTNEH
jgi:hypothetical protein